MAARKPKPTPSTVTPEAAIERPPMAYITNPVAVAHATPKTRDDIALRDAIRARLAVIESAISDFVTDKTSEGFSLDEIDQLYVVELPILFGYRVEGGRVRASYDAQIVERAG